MLKQIKQPKIIKISEKEIENLKNEINKVQLSDDIKDLLIKMLQGFVWLSRMVEAKKLSIRKISKLFGFKTEKSNKNSSPNKTKDNGIKKKIGKKKGHGRNGHDKYVNADRVFHQHEKLKIGENCPLCIDGKLYEIDPGIFINITGGPSLQAVINETQKLRCSSCGEIFNAEISKELKKQKYDAKADAMITFLKYGAGNPFYRQEKIQGSLGIPLPTSTQWDRVENIGNSVYPVFERLKIFAAQGELSYIDDTGNRIIDLKKSLIQQNSKRTGIYTTGIVSKISDKIINLFFTGNRYAGENLDNLLKNRNENLLPMLQMCDGSKNNLTKQFYTDLCNCLIHGRRQFKDIEVDRPKECQYVIHLIGKIYWNEKKAKKLNLNEAKRLIYHQKHSDPIIKKLRKWCLKCFYLKKVEPNENLGQAIQYLLNRWEKLTQFLRKPGAPLDTNIVERLLKKVILNKKNSLFYKTEFGAYVGDMMMSLIYTCVAAKKNPFNYLVFLHENKKKVFKNPENFFPWNYKENLN